MMRTGDLHASDDHVSISVTYLIDGEPTSPIATTQPKAYSALQRDPIEDLPFAITLSEKHFVNGVQINWTAMMEAMKLIPSDHTGPVCIDVESMINEDGTISAPWTVEHLRNIALFCLTSRPSAMWGWYGIPTRSYWQQTPKWRENNKALVGITEVCQCLMPTLYDYYGVRPGRDAERYGAIVELAREMATPGQQVLPYTHHRYHNSTWQFGYRLIPEQEHVEHLRNAINRGADGVIGWGGDRSNFINAWKRRGDDTFEKTGPSWDRIRQAWRDEVGGDDPTTENIEAYLYSVLYPSVHERLKEAVR